MRLTTKTNPIWNEAWWLAPLLAMGAALALGAGCTETADAEGSDATFAALLADGDPSAVPANAMTPAAPIAPPPRFCADCAREPLAFWSFDDCNAQSTELADTATSSSIRHPAFRAVSAACVAGKDGGAVRIAGKDDLVYAPDQPDFLFGQGVTVAAWINPDTLAGTQTIARKRLDGTSGFVLAIDDRKLVFALRLNGGRSAGVSAAIKARRFTHVAATFDGKQAVLYVDGAAAAKVKASGTIAAGAGPIFVGNDADGRRFEGTVDSLWLNTLAAPADTIKGLTCVHKPPVVRLTPAEAPMTPPETPVAFDLAVTNANDAACPASDYQLFASSLPFPLRADPPFGFLTVAPGQTGHAAIAVTAADVGFTGPVVFQYVVADAANFAAQATASATFVVGPAPPLTRTGCPATPNGPVAPGGYYVNGNTICTPDGRPHLLHGVDRPSLEWDPAGQNLSRADFALMSSWKANVVRIGLNQDFWLAGSPIADPSYPFTVDDAIAWAEMAGMDVILDLHWSDRGVLGSCLPANGCQQLMPDANSRTFWSEVAARYKNDGRVMFELYNEPHDISWEVWRNGGDTGQGWQAVGMQQLYDAVRATGAENLVLIGGVDWAYDLSGVPSHRIAGHNIAYATHPYLSGPFRAPSDWDRAWGFLTRTDPVVATEFGILNNSACVTDHDAAVVAYADAHYASWTAWAWFPGGCLFPAVIDDWAGTPSARGAIFKAALLGYDDPPASPPRPPTGTGPDLAYTFDHGTQGWSFNTYDDPTYQNLAVHPPAGGTAPAMTFDAAAGDPAPGALQVSVGFSALDQYVDANVNLAPPGTNLTGKTLHARVRLVSGVLPQGAVQFHASTGSSYTYGSVFSSADVLASGAWVGFDLDLATVTSPGYDPAHVVQIGVQVFSGFSNGGQVFQPTGDVVFEIDTVTD